MTGAQAPFRPPQRLVLAWVLACALAELLGIAAAGAWWVAMDRVQPEPPTVAAKSLMLLLKAVSGLVEGILLGWLQGRTLRRIYPCLSVRGWIAATSLLAVLGWGIGSSFAIFGAGPAGGEAPFEPAPLVIVALAAAFGLAVGALFGAVQALVLARAAFNAGWWIPANMIGWAMALPSIYLAASAGDGTQPLWLVAALGLGGGLVAGLLLGLVTAAFFRRMPPRPPSVAAMQHIS